MSNIPENELPLVQPSVPGFPGLVIPGSSTVTKSGQPGPPVVSAAALAEMIRQARLRGAAPSLILDLQRRYTAELHREAVTGKVNGGDTSEATSASPGSAAATPSLASNLLTFAVMTSPAWLVLLYDRFGPRRGRRARL